MSARGLPGFLRRSIRPVEYDDEEEDDEAEPDSVEPAPSAERAPESDNASGSSVSKSVGLSNECMERGESRTRTEPTATSDQRSIDTLTKSRPPANRPPARDETLSGSSWREPSSSGAPSSNTPTSTTTPTLNYRETQFAQQLDADVVNLTTLRTLAWNGVPYRYRPQVWKLLLGYVPTNAARRAQTLRRKRSEYRDARLQHYDVPDDARTVQEQETLRQVLVDVPRTQPDIPLFRNDRIKRVLSRILYIWAMRHPASSYVQGINDLATPLVSVF